MKGKSEETFDSKACAIVLTSISRCVERVLIYVLMVTRLSAFIDKCNTQDNHNSSLRSFFDKFFVLIRGYFVARVQ